MSAYNLRYIAILITVTLISFLAIKLVSKPPGAPLSGKAPQTIRPIPADAWIPSVPAGETDRMNTNEKKTAAAAKIEGGVPRVPLWD
ncbi:hypothetical protein [Desulfococcus sp.]|uniref:hypothetical protein n=1 Tax=Desulfococcus sp. TaxID=2025834 RepID=UPI003593B8BE